jgi:hypothetical protein
MLMPPPIFDDTPVADKAWKAPRFPRTSCVAL